jgi:hypothetical protein
MRALILVSLCFLALTGPALEAGSRSSANYFIPHETINSGGVDAQSANYSLRASAVGEFGGAGPNSTSASYINRPGYAGQLSDLLMLAVSEKLHSAAGPFDINLPLNGLIGIECRSGSSYAIVFKFANTLTSVASVNATATGMIQPGPTSGSIDPMDAHNYIANLTALPNAQYIAVTLGNVNDADGNFSNSVPAVMGLLIGDGNANGSVNASDVAQVKSRIGQIIDGTNFRSDVNANGVINSADVSNVKSNIGNGLP